MVEDFVKAVRQVIQTEVAAPFKIAEIIRVSRSDAWIRFQGSSRNQPAIYDLRNPPADGERAVVAWIESIGKHVILLTFSVSGSSGFDHRLPGEFELAPPSNLVASTVIPSAILFAWSVPPQQPVTFEVQTNTVEDEEDAVISVTTRGCYALIESGVEIFARVRSVAISLERSSWSAWVSATPIEPTAVIAFSDLTDVDPALSPTDGQVPIWDNAAGYWGAGDMTGGGGGYNTIEVEGVAVTARSILNFIAGLGIAFTLSDDSVVPQTNIVVASDSAYVHQAGDLVDRLRGGTHTAELFTLTNGVNEFDLVYESGIYYFAYDNKTETKLRSASTIAGLSGATDSTPVSNGRYPSIQLIDGTWHLWAWIATDLRTKHYTANTFTGTYTLQDQLSTNLADIHVRRGGDGHWYAVYKHVSTLNAGALQANNDSDLTAGWTDLGYVFADIGRAQWHDSEEADGALFWWQGRTYMSFAGWDGSTQRVGIVELNPSTLRAIFPATVIVNPLETWQRRNSQNKVFNPVWLALDGEPGRERLYYAQNVSTSGVASGWSYVEMGLPPPDGRRKQDGMRLDLQKGNDISAGIPATRHGSGAWSLNGLTTTSSTGGAYGHLGLNELDDFTLTVEFTPAALPSSGNFALLCRISTQNSAVNPIMAIWIRNNGGTIKLYSEIHNNAGSSNYNTDWTTALSTTTRYRAAVRKIGSEVRLYMNGVQETSGTHSGSLTALEEWAIANQKGVTNAASQQFEGTIHSTILVGEALPLFQL